MFEISDKLNENLQSLPLLDYLKRMHEWIEGIQHRNKSNSAYSECRTYARHVITRPLKEFKLSWENINDNPTLHHLKLSEEILDLYSPKESDKRKAARIKEFVDEFTYDLHSYIMALERRKDDPRAASEENPL